LPKTLAAGEGGIILRNGNALLVMFSGGIINTFLVLSSFTLSFCAAT
jgi:hypothetical protein